MSMLRVVVVDLDRLPEKVARFVDEGGPLALEYVIGELGAHVHEESERRLGPDEWCSIRFYADLDLPHIQHEPLDRFVPDCEAWGMVELELDEARALLAGDLSGRRLVGIVHRQRHHQVGYA